jgi:hypothetical protein
MSYIPAYRTAKVVALDYHDLMMEFMTMEMELSEEVAEEQIKMDLEVLEKEFRHRVLTKLKLKAELLHVEERKEIPDSHMKSVCFERVVDFLEKNDDITNSKYRS